MELLKRSSQLSKKSSSGTGDMAQMFRFDYTPSASAESLGRHDFFNPMVSCFYPTPNSDWNPLQIPPCPNCPALPTEILNRKC